MFHLLSFICRQVCAGEAKATNASRDLLKACLKGQTPIAWKCFGVNDCAVDWTGQWMTRFQFLSECLPLLSKNGDSHRVNYWLGGLHSPEGFITATRQRAAEVRTVLYCNVHHVHDFFVCNSRIDGVWKTWNCSWMLVKEEAMKPLALIL